jgi:hypothetical protein
MKIKYHDDFPKFDHPPLPPFPAERCRIFASGCGELSRPASDSAIPLLGSENRDRSALPTREGGAHEISRSCSGGTIAGLQRSRVRAIRECALCIVCKTGCKVQAQSTL